VKTVSIRTTGHEKSHFTVMLLLLACTADGGKLPPYIVFKRKTLPKECDFHDVSTFESIRSDGWTRL